MSNSGSIYFGVRPDMGTRVTVNSPLTYRDNQWHHVVGTLGGDGMKLYVDGSMVASNAGVTKAQVYRGYWRVGGDRLSSWPAAPTREAITASLDEIAVYPTRALRRPRPGALHRQRTGRHAERSADGVVLVHGGPQYGVVHGCGYRHGRPDRVVCVGLR